MQKHSFLREPVRALLNSFSLNIKLFLNSVSFWHAICLCHHQAVALLKVYYTYDLAMGQ